MSAFQHVVIVGATGNLGSAILSALRASSLDVTVLAREDSKTKSQLPEGTRLVSADFSSHSSLVTAFKGADAVISAIGSMAVASQPKLIKAAVEAGVKRFIPSEFGADTFNEKARQFPVYRAKIATMNYLIEQAQKGQIEWTAILGGPFLDWGLKGGLFGIKFAERKAMLFDGGKTHVSTTTLADLGQAVVGVLQHPSGTRNKALYVQTARVSQLQLLEMVEKHTNASYERVDVSTAEMEKQGFELVSKGDMSGMRNFLVRAIFAEGYGCDFDGREVDSLVGVKQLSSGELSELVADVIRSLDSKE